MYHWYNDRNKMLDSRLEIKVGHIQVMRMQHERFSATAKQLAKHYNKSYSWNYRLIQSILNYDLWREIKPLDN